MANLTNIINITLQSAQQGALPDNPNIVAIMTESQSVLSTADYYRAYTSVADVQSDFGADSNEASYAAAVLGKPQNPVSGGGRVVIGYHRGASEAVAATAATIQGVALTVDDLLTSLQAISDGSFSIDIDGTTVEVTGLDFRTVTTLAGISALIDAELNDGGESPTDLATLTFDSVDNDAIITSETTGASSTITVMSEASSGTFIGNIIKLAAGDGATLTQGAASGTLTAETKVAALTRLKSAVNFKGVMFIDESTTAGSITEHDAYTVGSWCQTNKVLGYDVFSAASAYTTATTNIAWYIKLAGFTNYRMMYHSAGNRKMAAAKMGGMHSVNFEGENTAKTMNLKSLTGVAPDNLSQTVIDACKVVGLDVYVPLKGSTGPAGLLTSGANDFTDNVYNKMVLEDQLQTDLANVLIQTNTKIAQDEQGVNQLVSQLEKTTRRFVRANVAGPGTWTSPDTFGDAEQFNRSIEQRGYFFQAGSLADQSAASREARESPVIQGAIKFTGAIHSADVIVNVNY
jgi:hypothetical protein